MRHNKIKHVVDGELDYMEPIECDICEEIFSRKENLIWHKQINHQCQGSSKFECNECGKQFSRRDALHRHKNVHQSVPNTIFSVDFVTQNSQKRIIFRGTRKASISKMGPGGISAVNVLIVSVILKCYDHKLIQNIDLSCVMYVARVLL